MGIVPLAAPDSARIIIDGSEAQRSHRPASMLGLPTPEANRDSKLLETISVAFATHAFKNAKSNEEVRSKAELVVLRLGRHDVFRQGCVSLENLLQLLEEYGTEIEGQLEPESHDAQILKYMKQYQGEIMIPIRDVRKSVKHAINKIIRSQDLKSKNQHEKSKTSFALQRKKIFKNKKIIQI